jgi:hypothetical protein
LIAIGVRRILRGPLPGETGTAATERQIARRASIPNAVPSATKTDQPGSEGANGGSATGAASYFPNLVLLTQDNEPVHFYDDLLKGGEIIYTDLNAIITDFTAANDRCTSAGVQQ